MTQAPLTPAEVLVLLDPNRPQGAAALKVTLLWLLASGFLHTKAIDHKSAALGLSWTEIHLGVLPFAAHAAGALPAHASCIVEMVRLAEAAGENSMPQIVRHAAARVFKDDFELFRRDLVVPALVSRRLIEPYDETSFRLFTRHRFRPTAAGEAERRRLQSLLDRAASIPEYLDRDPAQAVALAAALGSAILLLEPLRPHLDHLARLMRQRRCDSGGGGRRRQLRRFHTRAAS